MTIFQSAILGLIQGLSEFLPISSSGHLVLIPKIVSWDYQSLAFDAVLHLGTGFALLIYFRKELLEILKSARFIKLLFVGSIPAGLIGLGLESLFESYLRGISFVAAFLVLGSILMLIAEKLYTKTWAAQRINSLEEVTFKKAFVIGLFQAQALFPGFSRSGSTISGGMLLGLTREMAAKFSFLLSVPIVFAAGFYKIFESYNTMSFDFNLFVGFFVSFVFGLLAIRFLLRFLQTKSLYLFIFYRIALAALIIFLV